MRLICPNCKAEYEVDASVIPAEGRDVQCSNCGHLWFEQPKRAPAPGLAAEDAPDRPAAAPPEAVAAPADPDTAWETTAATEADDAHLDWPGAEQDEPERASPAPEPAPEPDPTPGAARREIDESVLGILREEAERERRVRLRETTAETFIEQPDLGLEPARRPPAPRPQPTPHPERDAVLQRARAESLPDIAGITSTLSASEDRAEKAVPPRQADPSERRRGFRRGFLSVLLFAGLGVGAYVWAPEIAGLTPSLEGPMQAYVGWVDSARLWIDETVPAALQALIDSLPEAGTD